MSIYSLHFLKRPQKDERKEAQKTKKRTWKICDIRCMFLRLLLGNTNNLQFISGENALFGSHVSEVIQIKVHTFKMARVSDSLNSKFEIDA